MACQPAFHYFQRKLDMSLDTSKRVGLFAAFELEIEATLTHEMLDKLLLAADWTAVSLQLIVKYKQKCQLI